ncbi:MAG TPA: endolytic transglycosylase MltG [Syntrophales bacterium]|nr:endolytic transglycosylase MltG [Syntrophales bacterium]
MNKKKIPIVFWALLGLIFFYFSFLSYAESPLSEGQAAYTVDIPKGASFRRIVKLLEQAGLVKHKLLFYLLAVSQNAAGHIRAGEYELAVSMSPHEMLRKMVKGQIKAYPVIFPEDITMKEAVARLVTYKLVDEKEFMKLASNQEFLASLGIEGANLEGYLYPDTYFLDRSMGTRDIIKIMVGRFWKKVTPDMLAKSKELGFTTQEFITLASIIGKESGNKNEKQIISAVFHNRLKKGMKLQSDPTAVYDLNNFDGIIKKKHLQSNVPYNTYRINGLPPGPIANPGIDSLQAALYPAAVNYLYFVSKNDGTHFFSSNFTAHNEAVSRYQNKKEKEEDAIP